MIRLKEELDHYDREVLTEVSRKVDQIAVNLERVQIADYINLMNKPWRLIFNNVLGGIARGVGIAIGVTVFTSTILYILQLLGALNLPIIGDYIARLIQVVQSQLEKP
ncbi:DUF5665 domain-containing protein [Gorillibacterium sp. sgz500922]|uniref:DUF5665 domain-containing protein n=1 Tax=Gorillibacterium sp. sgz500922 TaxID=3446694 RepID=UPI003F661BD9